MEQGAAFPHRSISVNFMDCINGHIYKAQHILMASHAAAAAPKSLSTSDILAGNVSEEVNHQAQFFGSLLHSLTELILLIIPPAVFT